MLKIEKITIPSANFGLENSLPPISEKLSLNDTSDEFLLDENDGLFIKYGEVESAFPYRYIDMYDRALDDKEYDSIVLENEYLKATFMPDFGGKLWSLIDKRTGRDLLFKNSVVRPCNLAVRNAWMSGGVEWNCGFRGHHPYTCSKINTAITSLDDGTPVLRFYYFERIRAVVVQMDFFLPDGERFLYARMRITNPNKTVVPMYWWSNIAVEEKRGDRVIVPTDKSYTMVDDNVIKIDIPERNGIDITYPARNLTANDYFWDLPDNARKYICQLDSNGYGLCQTSTSRLLGRKLFIWGDSQGGDKWKNFLTADDESGSYSEIQCGLAHTQYECLPMPPHTTWEWVEAYGAMQADAKKIHGSWTEARCEAEERLSSMLREERLEKILCDTRAMARRKAEKIICLVDGWAALEKQRRDKLGISMMCEHLVFGLVGEEQKDWVSLMDNGTVGEHDPEEVPISYNRQSEWLRCLNDAIADKDRDNWYAYYLLGTAQIADENYLEAKRLLEKSIELSDSAWANFALAITQKHLGIDESDYMLKAYHLRPNDVSLAKQTFKCLFEHEMCATLVELFESADMEIKENARCQLYYACALAHIGRIEEAEDVICPNGGYLVVPDIRECELTITKLWVNIQEQKGLTRETMGEIPRDLDFRMFAKREGWY